MKFSLSFEANGSNLLTNRRARMKPTFDQVQRLIVCVAGIVSFGIGIWMLQAGTSAKGVMDIKMELLSGHLETGSAGLFVMFFSFWLIVLSFFLKRKISQKAKVQRPQKSKLPTMVTVMVLLWILSIGSIFLACELKDSNETFYVGVFAFITSTFAISLSHYTYDRWKKQIEEKDE